MCVPHASQAGLGLACAAEGLLPNHPGLLAQAPQLTGGAIDPATGAHTMHTWTLACWMCNVQLFAVLFVPCHPPLKYTALSLAPLPILLRWYMDGGKMCDAAMPTMYTCVACLFIKYGRVTLKILFKS